MYAKLALLVIGCLLAYGLVPVAASAASPLGPGCDPHRPAVAHLANGVVLRPQPPGAPVPCGVYTGFPSGETRIVATNDGALIFSPAAVDVAGVNLGIGEPLGPGFIGIARSFNDGLTWSGLRPNGPVGNDWPGYEHADDQLYIDRHTGRVFWTNPASTNGGTAIVYTDNDGTTWHYSVSCCAETENPWITFGKPVTSQPHGYPTVVYYCANVGTLSTVQGAICHKSLDGGNTWITLGQGFTWHKYVPSHPQCGQNAEDAGYPSPTSDGWLYLIVDCGGKTYLARSTNEGATWPILFRLPFPGPAPTGTEPLTSGIGGFFPYDLRTDSENNMYVTWLTTTTSGHSALELSISTDRGLSWTKPIDVLAPSVVSVDKWYDAVGTPGHLEFSYLGQKAGQTTFDGYITETSDALAAHPMFWSAMINPPDAPLTHGPSGVEYDFIGADIGPDGTPWASFFAECGNAQPTFTVNPACINPPSRTTMTDEGFAGRLASPNQ